MNNCKKTIFAMVAAVYATAAVAQQNDSLSNRSLDEISVQSRRVEGVSRMGGAENGQHIGQDELFRAACCNLGESFVTNPSVDVNYNDAAVGAQQIKLLGLSGQYVQMLSENLPMGGGVAMPYLLSYVPGSWMKSISVSKGTASVKQGYESLTGQINVEYVKPEDEPGLVLNAYLNNQLKAEWNVVGNVHINKYLSAEVLAHYERMFSHTDENGDGWHDMPAINQLNMQTRWKYSRGRYIMHVGVGLLDEEREGGQLLSAATVPYRVLVDNSRYEAYMKHALLLNKEHNTNLAFLTTVNFHLHNGRYGNTDHPESSLPMLTLATKQNNLNSQLILEHDFNEVHNLSTGLSFSGTSLTPTTTLLPSSATMSDYQEAVPGIYAQYTYKPDYRLSVMAGLRADYSSLFGSFFTPRLHAKWVVKDWLTLRASIGKGYRTAFPLPEYHYLLASGRTLKAEDNPVQEDAWNTGLSTAFYIPLDEHTLTINAEYYYTNFNNQLVVDYDSDPSAIILSELDGRSFSHTAQVDATYPLSDQLDLTAAFRYNFVRCTYGGILMEKPLTSRYKGLVTVSWRPMMEIWHFDLTLQLCGGGRLPKHYEADGSLSTNLSFGAYPQLNAQVTRDFRHFSLYIGAENITGHHQTDPLINAANPWSSTFDPTMIWGPVDGIMFYAGLRMHLWKL